MRTRYVCERRSALHAVRVVSPKPVPIVGPTSADQYAATFRDLHDTRNQLGPKLNWDADILFAEIPAVMVTRLADAGTQRVDLRDWSWSIEFNTLAAQARAFTTFCETGRRLDKRYFRD